MRTRLQRCIYLEHRQEELLEQLARQTHITKAVLMRLAIDDLLRKHKLLKPGESTQP